MRRSKSTWFHLIGCFLISLHLGLASAQFFHAVSDSPFAGHRHALSPCPTTPHVHVSASTTSGRLSTVSPATLTRNELRATTNSWGNSGVPVRCHGEPCLLCSLDQLLRLSVSQRAIVYFATTGSSPVPVQELERPFDRSPSSVHRSRAPPERV